MTATLFSRDWYQIAELKPKLRNHVTVHEHRYRGKRWYLLEDHVTGQVKKLSTQSYLIVGLMNGQRTVDQLWEISADRLQDEMPTHEELLQLLSNLYQSNIIFMDVTGDVSELFERDMDARRKKWLGKLKSPLSLQIPIVDPEHFIEATQKYARPFFSNGFAAVWLLLVIYMLMLAGQHWNELSNSVSDRILAGDNLLLLWLIYPVIKLLHELGHMYAVKRGGGEVHEFGVMLLVLVPMPYVDASASSAFASKKNRMLVGAAGIIVEVFIASLAMLIWVNSEPGFIKSVAYNILFIAGVSTVLVNGNPLLRFDGYYVLSDFLEIPNLAQRANEYWGWLFKKIVFGVQGHQSPAHDKREALWLFTYGFAALIYRLFLMVTIVLFVAQQYFIIGVVLAIWSLVGTWIIPNIKLLMKPWKDGDISSGTRSPKLMMPILAGSVIFLLAILPMPLTTSVEGVIQLDNQNRLVAGESCFLSEPLIKPGNMVNKGDLLISCENQDLQTRQIILKHQLAEAMAERRGVWDDAVQLKIYDEELQRLNLELKENQDQLNSMKHYAQTSGFIWWVSPAEDIEGQYARRGDLLAYIFNDNDLKVRAMIPEADIKLVRRSTESINMFTASSMKQIIEPQSWHIFPAASKQLVSELLTENAGGTIVVDPSGTEPQAIQQYFMIDLLLNNIPLAHIEERVHVKFIHPSEALIYRTYRLIRRTFLEYFDV